MFLLQSKKKTDEVHFKQMREDPGIFFVFDLSHLMSDQYLPQVSPILTLCILKDFPIHITTISMGQPIVSFKGSQVQFS